MFGIIETVRKKPYIPIAILLPIALFATLPMFSSSYIVILLISVFMFGILCVSWNVFCGPSNYISLATAAFFGIGVYTSAILNALPLPLIIIIAGLLSLVFGLIVAITTLRLKGMYFCILTFGLSELFHQTMMWYEVNITGTVGRWLPLLDHVTVYYYMLGILMVTVLAAFLFKRSKWGLALQSIGEAEEAAAHIGINVDAVKIYTFAGTCFFMGATGAVMATRWSYIDPDLAFAPFVTFFVVMMVLVGGINSTIFGPLLGAVVLTVIPDTVLAKFPRLTMLLFGVTLLLVIMFLPEGLMGLIERRKKPKELAVREAKPPQGS
jgi:branched-chain amino acid transport system permease protein